MAGRALEHDKPDVKHVEAPEHASPAHVEVAAAQRAQSAGRDTQPKTEPKTLDLNQPIGGTAREFDSPPSTRGLSRDAAPAAPNSEAKAKETASPATDGDRFVNGTTDLTPSAGNSISGLDSNSPLRNPAAKMFDYKENGGMLELNEGGKSKATNFGLDSNQSSPSSQFKLDLNPNFKQNPPSLDSSTKVGDTFKHNDVGFTQFPPVGEHQSSGNPQVPKGLSDAPLNSSQKSIGQETPEAQKAQADNLLQNRPGQSAEQAAQVAANKALVNKFNEGVHRQTLIEKAGSGELGVQGGQVIAGMTESKAFRGEANKLTKE